MNFNEVIKDKGLKKGWIANQIGISQVLFSYYLTGTRSMPDHIKLKLKELLT